MNDILKLKGTLEIYQNIIGETEWTLIDRLSNLIVNTGYQAIFNRMVGTGGYSATTFTYFAWGDGTTTPTLTDTATTFYADCANSDTKLVTTGGTIEYTATTHTQTWNCYLSSTDNTVASITKFALMNTTPGTVMFSELKFNAIAKDATKQFYFRYTVEANQG